MLWSLFCFGGYSMASRDSGIKKYFLFRFGARHYEKTVPISVINSVMQMNGFPPRAARQGQRVIRRNLCALYPSELCELCVKSFPIRASSTFFAFFEKQRTKVDPLTPSFSIAARTAVGVVSYDLEVG